MYSREHISRVEAIASRLQHPFFILSGLLGLIPSSMSIPNYDFLLTDEWVENLAQKLSRQLRCYEIVHVLFYSKNKPTWSVYRLALEQATGANNIPIQVFVDLSDT